jgi:SRSO17 transposase
MKKEAIKNNLLSKKMSGFIKKELAVLKKMLEPLFARRETKESAFSYIQGLISLIERKNSWQLSEETGYQNPYAFQYLLGRALWNESDLRDEIRCYTIEHLGTSESVLSIDETGFLKKGNQSAGVGRQYSGTAGRIENCQIGVFLSYATSKGRALIDRELYIPQDWFEDENRRRSAGIPVVVEFKTKVELAEEMLKRTFSNGFKPSWVIGDEVYGCYALRRWLEEQEQSYVLAVASNYSVCIGLRQYRVKEVLEKINASRWKKISVGKGTKGERYYEWFRIKINSDSPKNWNRWLIIRRSIKDAEEVAFYIGFSKDENPLEEMAKAAGSRWTIEECFEMAKGEVGLDHYEVRSFTGWYRHITLSIFALSYLVKLRTKFNQNEMKGLKKKGSRQHLFMQRFLQNRGLV